MIEAMGDIWEYAASVVIAITTNSLLTRDGQAILERAVARRALLRFRGITDILGRRRAEQGFLAIY